MLGSNVADDLDDDSATYHIAHKVYHWVTPRDIGQSHVLVWAELLQEVIDPVYVEINRLKQSDNFNS